MLCAAAWVSHGPIGGAVRSMAVAQADRRIIYVAEADGVFRSSDSGATWNAVTGPMIDPSLVLAGGGDPNVVVAAASNGVFRTVDGGETWQMAGGLPKLFFVAQLLADPRDDNVIYLGGACYFSQSTGGLFKSVDGGRTFFAASSGLTSFQQCISQLALDPAAPDHLFLRFDQYEYSGAVRSTDGGHTWSDAAAVPTQSVVVAANGGGRRFGIDPFNFYTSADGVAWSLIPQLKSDRGLLVEPATLAIDPNAGRLFLGTNSGAFRSGDGGLDWLSLDGAARDSIKAIDFDTASGGTVIGTDTGIFRSSGYPWNDWTDLHVGNNAMTIDYVAADPSGGGAYALSGRHLFHSTDRGSSWKETAPPLPGFPDQAPSAAIVVDAGHDVYVNNVFYDGRDHLVRLRSDGAAWDEVIKPSQLARSTALAANPRQPGMLYYSDDTAIWRTLDRGNTWEQIKAPSGLSVTYAFAGPRDPDTFLCLARSGDSQLMKTTDAGRTWTLLNKFPSDWTPWWIASSPEHPDVLYMAAWTGIVVKSLVRSVDGGKTWAVLPKQPGYFDSSLAGIEPEKLAIDPRDPNILYVATTFDYPRSPRPKVERTTDGGTSWQPFDGALPDSYHPALAIDPNDASLYFATAARGVWQLDLGSRRRTTLH